MISPVDEDLKSDPLPHPGQVLVIPAQTGYAVFRQDRGLCAADDDQQLVAAVSHTPIITVVGLRGTDVLKVLLRTEASTARQILAHDAALMRNALEGFAPKNESCHFVLGVQEHLKAVHILWERLQHDAGAMRTYTLNLRAMPAVATMELVGVPFNSDGLASLVKQWRKELDGTQLEVRLAFPGAGRAGLLNLRSSKQIGDVIRRHLSASDVSAWPKTQSGALRTDAATLRASSLPFARRLARSRRLEYLLSHFVPFEKLARSGRGRLYPSYNLCGAVTGRMSCTSPNIMALPRLPEFRSLVAAGRGGCLVKADFSQIELRVLSEVSLDTRMRDAFLNREDLHKVTAGALLGVNAVEVTHEQRQRAKAVNFGLIYGQSAAGLRRYAEASYGVQMSSCEARRARCDFFRAYPGVATWQKSQRHRASSGQLITTPSGRCAHHLHLAWKDILQSVSAPHNTKKKHVECGAALSRVEREALNFPIQGGAAEVMLATLDIIWHRLAPLRPGCKLICVVHDEFLVECTNDADAERVASVLRCSMQAAWLRIFPSGVPLDDTGVSVSVGHDWSHARASGDPADSDSESEIWSPGRPESTP